MGNLRFELYNQGNCGLFNILMSLELGVALSVLSSRTLLVHMPPYPLFNSEKRKFVFDLCDVRFPHEVDDFKNLRGALLPDLHSTRLQPLDWLQLEDAATISSRGYNTLGYYSYVLPYDERVVQSCNGAIQPNDRYHNEALAIVNELWRKYGNKFASVHVRRKDFIWNHHRARVVEMDEILYNIRCHVPQDYLLLIHSDETDARYFQELTEVYPSHWLIDKCLFQTHYPSTFDSAEIGFVSAIVASYSEIFLGTMLSTFTGYIQRKRILNGKSPDFLYIYNQRPGELEFRDGRIVEKRNYGHSWERFDMSDQLRSICFWWREWPEAVFNLGNSQ
jgi:hypothetical protein